MGMAASQVRFLTLQDRKSSIGMRLGVLSNRKMALARDMNRAAKAYNDAYSETKLQWYDSIDGTYEDITYEAMMTPQTQNSFRPYILTDRNTGKVILDGAYGKETPGILGYGGPSAESNAFWAEDNYGQYGEFLPQSPSTSVAVSGTMPYHMERLTGIATNRYMPGTVSFVEDKMAPYIVEQIMGIPNFDRNKKVYEAVENATLRDGGYEKLVHSDVMNMIDEPISQSAINKTTSLLSVWEFRNDANDNKFTYHRALDISTGEYIDVAIDDGGNESRAISKSVADQLKAWAWASYLADPTGSFAAVLAGFGYGMYDNVLSPNSVSDLSAPNNTPSYIDSSGNAHNLTDKTYWSTLYNDNASVLVKRNYTVSRDNPNSNEKYDFYSINYTNSMTKVLGSGKNDALYQWALGFAQAANDSDIFRYNMDGYLNYIAEATARTLSDAWYADWDESTGSKNYGIANVDTYLDSEIYPDFSKWEENDRPTNADGNTGVQNFIDKAVDDIECSIYADDDRSAIGNGTANGTNDLLFAIAKEANETISPIIAEAAHFQVENDNTGKCIDASTWYGADRNAAFSVKNMMEVEMYYINMVQEKLAETDGAADTITSANDLYNTAKTEFGYDPYTQGKNRDYTSPETFSQGEIEVFRQGETRVASVYSILSNLEMLKEKVEYCATLDDTPASHVDKTKFEKIYNAGSSNYNMQGKLSDILNGVTDLGDDQLIALANFNAWVCEALKQDYSTVEGVTKLNDLLEKIKESCDLYRGNNCAENNWDYSQSNYADAFYYDSNTRWNRRTQLFSQNSEAIKATSHIDVEGQLTALQFHQYKFYVNLITECLARGWKDQSDNAGYSDIDPESVTLHLQNGTWLINDTMAKSSSRVFEVTNIEAREEALSKYEMLQADLKVKEEDVDMEMKRLITEQNSVNAEMECLQNIISENIKETFKVFNA